MSIAATSSEESALISELITRVSELESQLAEKTEVINTLKTNQQTKPVCTLT